MMTKEKALRKVREGAFRPVLEELVELIGGWDGDQDSQAAQTAQTCGAVDQSKDTGYTYHNQQRRRKTRRTA